ncbi:MAG: hypothetical protein DRP74_07620 [Candidatus Omnitrophota bacterium]|nr:MAG: hypothetical protein DRP74_07620 [Candidatus Omnitrophota bacterium]
MTNKEYINIFAKGCSDLVIGVRLERPEHFASVHRLPSDELLEYMLVDVDGKHLVNLFADDLSRNCRYIVSTSIIYQNERKFVRGKSFAASIGPFRTNISSITCFDIIFRSDMPGIIEVLYIRGNNISLDDRSIIIGFPKKVILERFIASLMYICKNDRINGRLFISPELTELCPHYNRETCNVVL